MRKICFHGRRERDKSGDFLLAARIIGAAAASQGISAQVRTPMWPSPPGSPDRALVRLNEEPLADMRLPKEFDLEFVCDPKLAVIPPMGNALLPWGALLINAATRPWVPEGGPKVFSADLGRLASGRGAPAGFSFAGAVWGALGIMAPELGVIPGVIGDFPPANIETPLGEAEKALLHEAQALGSNLFSGM